MKIRKDFVTNSSSANYVLSLRSEELNKKRKKAVCDYVCQLILRGSEITLDNLSDSWLDDDVEAAAKKHLEEGKKVVQGYVSFEEADYHLAEIYEDLMGILEKNSDGDLEILDGDLSY